MTISRRISADEARHLRSADMRGDRLVKLASTPTTWNANKRSARFVMTSAMADRMGDIVSTDGLSVAEFMRNPQAFLNHKSSSWSIGQWTNIVKHLRAMPPRMEGDLILHEASGPVPEIDQAAWMIERGYMKACSIGFLPDWSAIEKVLTESGDWTGGLRFNRAELLECSLCGIPANPQALAKGLNPQDKGFAAWLNTPEGERAARQHVRQLELAALKQRGPPR
jgi:hypothetical protein